MSLDPGCFNVQSFTVSELLSAYGAILDELRRREVVRSANSPLSDYAEVLFCRAFGWTRENNSAAGHDATDGAGTRYQVKGRRLTRHNASRQMSAIRISIRLRSTSLRVFSWTRPLGHSRCARSRRHRACEIDSCHPY